MKDNGKASRSKSTRKTAEPKKPAGSNTPDKAIQLRSSAQSTAASPGRTGMHSGKEGAFYIVGIGASAGGLEAFEQFFTNMPPDSGMAFVLIPHLSPEHKSIMAELLNRHTKMNIVQAEDGIRVNPDCVYIIPPNKDMAILKGTLQLLDPVERRGLRHPIDFFFRSLAADQGERAVCVILSGTGSEGTLGLGAIKEKGGLVIVQDPKTARYDGMPRSAMATGIADYVLSPDKIPGQLLSYIKHAHAVIPEQAARAGDRDSDPLQKIIVLIRDHTGHDFSLYRQNTIINRIKKRMAILQIRNITEYVSWLRSNPQEIEKLFNELLIRVTTFFREREAFEIITQKALPLMFKDRPSGEPLRIWVPGCSTGEEAYSIAITVQEYLDTHKQKCSVQIFATDMDKEAIDMARAGLYPDSIAADVTPERLNRFFIRKAAAYKIKEEIRQNVVFALQNIIKDPPFTKLDMISCRNVLIYFGADLHEKVVPLFHNSLKPGGILFLGSSESIGAHVDMFSVVDRKWKIFRTRGVKVRPAIPFEMRKKVEAERGAVPAPALRPRREFSMKEVAEKTVIDRYAPPFVIIDRKGDILYFHGRTNSYLQPPSGRASLNIIEMAREELRLELRIALRKALARRKKITVEGLPVKTDGGIRTVNLEILQPEPLQGLLMVVFKELAFPKGQKAGKASPPSPGMRPQIAELEHELKSTKEQLQTTIEELETSNQELGATNEELQSSNEELQSTIEEMETSKEELQSVNEELTTINTELQFKMDELFQLNNDMNNLITSTQLATIFLDNRLRIKRFTPATVKLLNLMGADVGRYIGDFTLKLDYPDLEKDIGEALRELVLKERVVRHREGLWYLARILPYRTTENAIDGAVITFIDITGQKKAEEAQKAALAYAEGIVETVRESLLVLDSDLRVITANKSFYQTFRTSRNDVEKKLVYDLGNGQWAIPALRVLLEKILPENTQIENFEVVHDFPDVGHKKMLLNARRIYEHGKRTLMILLAIEDMTGRKK